MGGGFSRDDAGKFLKDYVDKEIYEKDPFQSLDQEGIGELLRIAVSKGRETNKKLIIGICGEHGGDPATVMFCHDIGLNYVSCSPYRVPIARLAAAQGVINQKIEAKKNIKKAVKKEVKKTAKNIKKAVIKAGKTLKASAKKSNAKKVLKKKSTNKKTASKKKVVSKRR